MTCSKAVKNEFVFSIALSHFSLNPDEAQFKCLKIQRLEGEERGIWRGGAHKLPL